MRYGRGCVVRRIASRDRRDGVAAVAALVNGSGDDPSEISEIRSILSDQIGRSLEKLLRIVDRKDYSSYYLLPYLSRVILEASSTVALSRLDPFRVLLIKKAQLSGDYDQNRRSLVAIDWGRDILTKDGQDDVKWSSLKSPDTYSRALLDSVWAELSWGDSIAQASDACREFTGIWVRDLRNSEQRATWKMLRGQCGQLYSDLSKFVHVEYLHAATLDDRNGMVEKSSRAVKVSILFLYIANFVSHSTGRLVGRVAAEKFVSAQNALAEF